MGHQVRHRQPMGRVETYQVRVKPIRSGPLHRGHSGQCAWKHQGPHPDDNLVQLLMASGRGLCAFRYAHGPPHLRAPLCLKLHCSRILKQNTGKKTNRGSVYNRRGGPTSYCDGPLANGRHPDQVRVLAIISPGPVALGAPCTTSHCPRPSGSHWVPIHPGPNGSRQFTKIISKLNPLNRQLASSPK
jgi:hypothetical protein